MKTTKLGAISAVALLLAACGATQDEADPAVGHRSEALSTGSTTIPSTGQSFDIEIASETHGVCTEVVDPSDLSEALSNKVPSGLDSVEVNGTEVSVDSVGNFSRELTCTSGAVLHIEAVAFADDVDETTVAADITVQCCTDSDGDGSCDEDDPCPRDPADDARRCTSARVTRSSAAALA